MTRTCVYQAFDANKTLLYVGLSKHWPRRWAAHSQANAWWPTIARLHIEWVPNLYAALWYEGYLIRLHRPRFNKHIPALIQAPDCLSTKCSLCPTGYSVCLRPPGTRCEDLSLKPWTEEMTEAELLELGCHGICELVVDGKWECMA